jgi:DNA-binding NarL/FixJ family response regulator
MKTMAPTRLVIVDDHEVARRGLRSVISSSAELEVLWEAVDGEEAVEKVRELQPDVVLLDISLPGISGIEAARQIREVSPQARIVFVSQHDSIRMAKDALASGATCYVVKSDAGRDLLIAIEAAREGRVFVSRSLVARGWI